MTEGQIRGKYHQDTNAPRSNPAISQIHKNMERYTVHTTDSWPNPKQWVKVHTSDLMMIRRVCIFYQPSQRKWVNWKHTAPHIVLCEGSCCCIFHPLRLFVTADFLSKNELDMLPETSLISGLICGFECRLMCKFAIVEIKLVLISWINSCVYTLSKLL